MEEKGTGEGFSPKKVVAGAALGVAVPAAVAVAKKLVGGNGDEPDANEQHDQARDEPISRERRHTTRTKAAKPKSSARARTRTREQLYKQATRLKIEGRSSMNKA